MLVDYLSEKTTSESLKAHFAQYGEIEHCYVSRGANGKSNGFGVITYASEKSCQDAVRAGQCMLDGQVVLPKQAIHVVFTMD